jgi:hypothetical protein
MGAAAKNRRLTPLQAKLAAKLEAAHFRMLNEELYTTPSSAAVAALCDCVCAPRERVMWGVAGGRARQGAD